MFNINNEQMFETQSRTSNENDTPNGSESENSACAECDWDAVCRTYGLKYEKCRNTY